MGVLGNVRVVGNNHVRIMGIINTSPESFFTPSVKTTKKAITETVIRMADDGADIIDVGGMSTAPYKSTRVSIDTEIERVIQAIRIITNNTNIPISVDTCNHLVADAACHEGASIINDVTGLHHDSQMCMTIRNHNPSLILCAHSTRKLSSGNPIIQTIDLLRKSIKLAHFCNVADSHIVLDPAIGFFRGSGNGSFYTKTDMNWTVRDLIVLSSMKQLCSSLKYDFLVSASNKSFLGAITGDSSIKNRLAGSLASELVAVMGGAKIIRTHNVAFTKKALAILSS